MSSIAQKRRAVEDARRPKKKLKIKKRQKEYHSSSEEEDGDEDVASGRVATDTVQTAAKPRSILKEKAGRSEPIISEVSNFEIEDGLHGMNELERNTALNAAVDGHEEDDDEDDDEEEPQGVPVRRQTKIDPSHNEEDEEEGEEVEDDDDDDDDDDSDEGDVEGDADSDLDASNTSSNATQRTKKKRNDPSAFATSISKILDTRLTTSKRADPVLSRSKTAAEANRALADDRLEQKARAQMRAEKKAALEKGRVKDVLGLERPEVDTGAALVEERRLKKTAQRGVVKLFNAVRAAQVRAEEGMHEARSQGVVGMKQREEKVNEMSKQGFLDLISSGGTKTANVS